LEQQYDQGPVKRLLLYLFKARMITISKRRQGVADLVTAVDFLPLGTHMIRGRHVRTYRRLTPLRHCYEHRRGRQLSATPDEPFVASRHCIRVRRLTTRIGHIGVTAKMDGRIACDLPNPLFPKGFDLAAL
jgi:hypothetical protein